LIVLRPAGILVLSLIFDPNTASEGGGPWWTTAITVAGWIARPANVATLLIDGVRLREQRRQQLAGGNDWFVVRLLLTARAGTFGCCTCTGSKV